MPTTVQLCIFLFCMIACGSHSWFLGRREGIEETLIHLHDEGIINLVDDEEDQ